MTVLTVSGNQTFYALGEIKNQYQNVLVLVWLCTNKSHPEASILGADQKDCDLSELAWYETCLRWFVLKASAVKCWSILLIIILSIDTLDQHLDQYSIDNQIDIRLALYRHLINSQSIVDWLVWINWKLSLNQLSTTMLQSVDIVSTKVLMECRSSVDLGMPLVHTKHV